jgi:hypothetical protein
MFRAPIFPVEAIKTTYFVATSPFFTFTVSTMHGHMNIKLPGAVSKLCAPEG